MKLPRRLAHGEEASLVEHLGELRARIVIALVAIAVGFVAAYVVHGHLVRWLENALPKDHQKLTTLSPAEPFLTSMWISLYAGFLLALPVVLYQVWAFFAPAFAVQTQRIVIGLAGFAAFLAAGGLVFGYFVALPAAVHFLTNYDDNLYNIQIRAKDYLSFASIVLFAVTIVFDGLHWELHPDGSAAMTVDLAFDPHEKKVVGDAAHQGLDGLAVLLETAMNCMKSRRQAEAVQQALGGIGDLIRH